ncbi:ATP-binding protein [Azospirillum sp. sgz301742]
MSAWPRRSIRKRLIAAFFGLAVGPLLLLALFLLPYSAYTRLESSLLRQDEAARRVTLDVAVLFRETEASMRAALGEVQTYGLTGPPLHLRLDALIAEAHRFSSVSLVDRAGIERARVEYDAIVGPDDLRDLHALAPVDGALASGATAYGPAEFDAQTGEPSMLVVMPALAPDQRTVEGALVARLRIKPIWHVVAHAWAAQDLDAYVVDPTGRVIAHRSPSVVLSERRVALPLEDGLTRGLNGGWVARASVGRPVGGQTLTTIVDVPAAEALGPTLRLLGVTMTLLLGGIAVAAVLVRRARRSITRPLRELVETVQAITAGDLTRQAEAHRNDEVGDLARAFNEMTERLRDLIGALRLEVATRTDAEEALRRLNEELEERVSRRTAELAGELAERRRAEQALTASEGRVRAIMDTVLEGIVVADERGIIQAFNPAAERIFGLTAAQAIGNELGILMAPADAAAHRKYLERYLMAGEAWVIGRNREVTGRRRDGSEFPLDIAVSELITDEGRLFIGALRDISARKAIERQLIAAKDQAESANRAKSEFLNSMSHELRTPLNAILGFAQLLEMDSPAALPAKRAEYVQLILRAGHHLLSLIEDVLDLAKIEAGRVELAVEPVALGTAVTEALDIVGPVADAAGITIVNEAGDGAPLVLGDARRVRQALVNLLSNGVKYNRPGGRVTVSVKPGDGGRPRVLVTDTGRGIPQDRLGELFEPFNRLNAERSAIEGTGIGLAITRRLIESMGGEVGATSQEGVGSTFWIALPAAGWQAAELLEVGAVGR